MEMIIVIGIFAALTLIFLFNYKDFSISVETKNVAYEVALSIREAQISGISAKIGSGDYNTPYGVYFSSPPNNSFETFIDGNNNGLFQKSESVDTLRIGNNINITGIKVGNGSTCTIASNVSVTFKRPDIDAIIKTTSSSNHELLQLTIQSLRSSDFNKYIIVRSAGQVYVSDYPQC